LLFQPKTQREGGPPPASVPAQPPTLLSEVVESSHHHHNRDSHDYNNDHSNGDPRYTDLPANGSRNLFVGNLDVRALFLSADSLWLLKIFPLSL